MFGQLRKVKTLSKLILETYERTGKLENEIAELKLLCGSLHAALNRQKGDVNINANEFKVFSQFGDDGIIQFLTDNIAIPNKTFIEFGVEDFFESNTRFLMMKNNWQGFVMDGSEESISRLTASNFYWKFGLKVKAAFITAENINELLAGSGFEHDLGLMHIDLDGNDYWIWQKIEKYLPRILILEYNAVFGRDNCWTVPYDPVFQRFNAHYSGLFWGASLPALFELSQKKGYDLVGCNSAGNNAYFVRRDINTLPAINLADGFKTSLYRESRDREGRLSFLSGNERLKLLAGQQVFDTRLDKLITITTNE